jgi:hypothetical protein
MVALASLMLRSNAAMAQEALVSPQYVALRLGFTTTEFSPQGWWIDAGVLKQWPLSSSWYVTVEAALAAARDRSSWTLPYFDKQPEQPSHNRRLLIGIPLRVGIGLGPGVFGFELGAVAGAAYSSLKSDICSNQAGLKPMLGAYAGPVLRLGQERSIRIAAQIQSISPIMPRCTNTGDPDGAHYVPVWFSDTPPDPAFVSQLAMAW